MQETVAKTPEKRLTKIDFNCDAAQVFGFSTTKNEDQILDYISSVSIATGFHAGDPVSIKKAIQKAKERNISIGAHIGFNDLQGFGNRPMNLSDDELESLVIYQVGALMTFAKACGAEVEYVRPHGAMYKMASEDFSFSCAIARAIKKCSNWLLYYGEAGDTLEKVGDFEKIRVVNELKINKSYTVEGKIDYDGKDVVDIPPCINRLHTIVKTSRIDNNAKGFTPVRVDSIHFSASAPNNLVVARRAYELIKPVPVNFNRVKESGWV